MTPNVAIVLVCVTPSRFQGNLTDLIGFTFAPHWFVKMNKLLRLNFIR